MKVLVFVFAFFLAAVAMAQSSSTYTEKENEVLVRTGNIFTLRITRGEPLKIFVFGREEAQVSLSDLKLRVRRLKPYPVTDLPVQLEKDYFYINGSSSSIPLEEIEIITTEKAKKEKFKVNLKKP